MVGAMHTSPKFAVGSTVDVNSAVGLIRGAVVERIDLHGVSEAEGFYYKLRTPGGRGFYLAESSLMPTAAAPVAVQSAPTAIIAGGKTWSVKAKDESALRKMQPIGTVLKSYFPLGFRGVAAVSAVGNYKHNPGEPLHWARGRSDDHLDCAARHLTEGEDWDVTVLPDGRAFAVLHAAQAAWRALALAQLKAEEHGGKVILELEPRTEAS